MTATTPDSRITVPSDIMIETIMAFCGEGTTDPARFRCWLAALPPARLQAYYQEIAEEPALN